MPRRDRRRKGVHPNQVSKGPQPREAAFALANEMPERKKELMVAFLNLFGDGTFWTLSRMEQVNALLVHGKSIGVTHSDVATVMGVRNGTVTKYKHRFQDHPENLFPLPGRPSQIGEVFVLLKNFIARQIAKGRTVTMGVLMEYANGKLRLGVQRSTLLDYMKGRGYQYVSAKPMEDRRVVLSRDELRDFYEVRLPAAVNGAHPSLVYNMDEMGAERFADRKRIYVLFPPERGPVEEGVAVGVPRSARRCTLMACIAMDGTRLKPAVITKTPTMNSKLFETGYGPESLTLFTTKNSFITRDVFGEWLTKTFIPHVEKRRRRLRRRIPGIDTRAVLILDQCSCHVKDEHRQMLARRNITLVFLPAHTSHLTQPLDLGVFGRLKNVLRDEAAYSIGIDAVDDAVAEEHEPDDNPGRPPPSGASRSPTTSSTSSTRSSGRRRGGLSFPRSHKRGFSTMPRTRGAPCGGSSTSTPRAPGACARRSGYLRSAPRSRVLNGAMSGLRT